jgi:hypothetical protein
MIKRRHPVNEEALVDSQKYGHWTAHELGKTPAIVQRAAAGIVADRLSEQRDAEMRDAEMTQEESRAACNEGPAEDRQAAGQHAATSQEQEWLCHEPEDETAQFRSGFETW